MTDWKPMGNFVIVELHRRESTLELQGEAVYDGLGTVLAVGPKVEGLSVGDTVIANGTQGLIGHKALGEHLAIVPQALLLARREPGSALVLPFATQETVQ